MTDSRINAWRTYRDETPEIDDVENARADFLAGWDAAKARSPREPKEIQCRQCGSREGLHVCAGSTDSESS